MRLREFAAAIGVHMITAHRWEHGIVPNPKAMQRILELFPEISAEEYYRRDVEPQVKRLETVTRNECC